MILALFLAIRSAVIKRLIILDDDALILPTGFGRIRTKRIAYVNIERVKETVLPFGTTVLSIATKEGKFEVVSMMLPDTQSYIDLKAFLSSRSTQNKS